MIFKTNFEVFFNYFLAYTLLIGNHPYSVCKFVINKLITEYKIITILLYHIIYYYIYNTATKISKFYQMN